MQAEENRTRRSIQQSLIEPRILAETVQTAQAAGIENINLTETFASTQKKGLCKFEKPETLSAELAELEDKLIGNFAAQIRSYENVTAEQADEAIVAVREAIYSLIMGGHLTGEKIQSLVNNGINFRDKPGEETISSKGVSLLGNVKESDVVAFYRIENESAAIFLYAPFLSESRDAKSFGVLHEFGHIVARNNFWPEETYKSFLQAARDPGSADLQQFARHPELQQILQVLQDPAGNSGFFRSYIRTRLETVSSLPEEQQGRERSKIAEEIIADMFSYYYMGGNNAQDHVSSRMTHLYEQDAATGEFTPDRVIKLCLEKLGLQNLDQLYKVMKKKPKSTTPSQLCELLIQNEKLNPMFGSSASWTKLLNQRSKDRGNAIPGKIGKGISASGVSTGGEGNDNGTGFGNGQDVWGMFWDFATGVKTKENGLF